MLWKIHAYGVWLVCIKLSDREPDILLADLVEKKDIILIYRVKNPDKTFSELIKSWDRRKKIRHT